MLYPRPNAPFLIFATIYGSALTFLALQRLFFDVQVALIEGLVYTVLLGATTAFTCVQKTAFVSSRAPISQLVVCIFVVVFTGVVAACYNGLVNTNFIQAIAFVESFSSAAEKTPRWLTFGAIQFILYVALTLVLLIPFRVCVAELGIRFSIRSTLITALIWLTPAVAYLLLQLHQGLVDHTAVMGNLIRNTFQDGFSEEFLFRGALMSSLANVVSLPWAILIQAIIFGFWHIGFVLTHSHQPLMTTLCLICVHQILFGYGMGCLQARVGSLIVPSLFHAVTDSIIV